MKKKTIIYLVLAGCIAGSVIFERYLGYAFYAGITCGAAAMLMILNYFGEKRLRKATGRVDKIIKDRIVAIENDNLQIDEDD